ncbi:MAG: hypothetical protein OQJ96_05920 [Flavobacteriales bacterium]|nr:hypothetical protein [Flavobacteriales bacterium]MCW8937614.1 hypothetical protein [Flavobacteriales bacterium]MCW8968978.1 hypothetical protein [Flavobacteriales bacterium]MCW8990102.1 hypothetical protein [Flavobacteriales bacterium]MCW9019820.1 hypothetical protein [Flavobacteriales bacterium]
MKKPIYFLLFIMCSTQIVAQSNFEKVLPSQVNNNYDIEQTSDGGYIIGGGSLAKTNPAGDTLWTRRHFSIGQYSAITGVTQTTDGGYAYVVSTKPSSIWQITLVKTNSSGDTTFTKKYGGALESYGCDIIQTTDGGYLVTGTLFLSPTDYRIYVVKTDVSGNEVWNYTHPIKSQTYSNSVVEIPGNKYVIAGQSNLDATLIKLDNTGTPVWAKTHGEPTLLELARGLSTTSAGGFVYTGWQYDVTNSTGSSYLVKTDVDGDTLWTRNETQSWGGNLEGYGFDTKELSNGDIMMTGSVGISVINNQIQYGNLFITYFNGSGTKLTSPYPCTSTNTGTAIAPTSDGGYIISGGISSIDLLIKLDANLCVYPTDTISLMNTGDPNKFCANSGFLLQVPTNSCNQVLWDNASTNNQVVYNPPNNNPGSYYVTLTNNFGCSINDTIVLDTFVTAQPVIASTTGDTAFCQGDSLILYTGNWNSYYWSPGASINDTNIVFTGGSYTVQVTDANSCSTVSDPFVVTVHPLPTPNISLQPNNDLVSSETTGNQWYLNGVLISGATNQIYTPTVTGTYTVEVTDANGCVGISPPYVLTTVGINKHQLLSDVFSYTNGRLTVHKGVWQLYDMTGRMVLNGSTGSYVIPVGIYILHTEIGANRIAHIK